jgi:4-azaleucine resistance transporter AzlC
MLSGGFLGSVKNGVARAAPIILGYIPVGMAYGLLARESGTGIGATLGLSLFVFAGASQFMAVSMLAAGAEPAVIIGAALIVNFRHVLMSASLSPALAQWGKFQRVALGATLTDESYPMHALSFADGEANPAEALSLNLAAYLAWAASGAAGYILGVMIRNPKALGVDFALPAMFIGLLVPACKNYPSIAAAVCGGGASVVLRLAGAGSWAVFFGAIVGATAGVLLWRDAG